MCVDSSGTELAHTAKWKSVRQAPVNAEQALWCATSRIAPGFWWLLTDLYLLGQSKEYEHITSNFVELLKLLGSTLLPAAGSAPVEVQRRARPEVELASLMSCLTLRSAQPPLSHEGHTHTNALNHGSSKDPWHSGKDPWDGGKAALVDTRAQQVETNVISLIVQYIEKNVELPHGQIEKIVGKSVEFPSDGGSSDL